jgi:SulP family sulfate permease
VPHRHQTALVERPLRELPGLALRRALASGYGPADLRADLLAGVVVGIVALPLSMALAIASGVAPQHGLYTAIIAGGAIPLLGGSRSQVSGPTAAFVVVLTPVSSQFGVGGLLIASVLAGLLLLLMGAFRLGALIRFVPHPVTTGFTAGIALVIATLQVKDLLGLHVPVMPHHYLERVQALAAALPTAQADELAVGLGTLALLLLWPRLGTRLPAPLVALGLAALGAWLAARLVPGFAVDTIGSRFSYASGGATLGGIPRTPPLFAWPWSLPGPDGRPLVLSLDLVRALLPPAFAIAMLGAIESLLSAVVADGMDGSRHDPDAELLAQGVGNLVAPFFGGFAATGALARTATNVRAGARSPMAAFFHAGFVLLAVLALAPLLGQLPMSALAALLLLVAWNMSELKHFAHVVRVAPRSDVTVLLVCFALTVVFDMVVAVSVGVVLAALLFMRRMAELSSVSLVGRAHAEISPPLPPSVVVYDIGGPLFFGAAQKAMSSLEAVHAGVRTVVLDVRDVPAMDATGLVSLESTIERLRHAGVAVILGGVNPQPAQVLERAGWRSEEGRLVICEHFDDAIALARLLAPPPPAAAAAPRRGRS